MLSEMPRTQAPMMTMTLCSNDDGLDCNGLRLQLWTEDLWFPFGDVDAQLARCAGECDGSLRGKTLRAGLFFTDIDLSRKELHPPAFTLPFGDAE